MKYIRVDLHGYNRNIVGQDERQGTEGRKLCRGSKYENIELYYYSVHFYQKKKAYDWDKVCKRMRKGRDGWGRV